MENKLNGLNQEFKEAIITLIDRCNIKGFQIEVIQGNRNPFMQAKFWRGSRTQKEIQEKIDSLRFQKAHFLAYCIDSIGPQQGKFTTNAIPGLSWHQWGEAVDFGWVIEGKFCWNTSLKVHGYNGYELLAIEAKRLGLNPGFFWEKFKDAGHIQFRKESSPASIMNIKQIDYQMQLRYEKLIC